MRSSDWSSACALPISFRDRLWALGYHGVVEDGDYYGYSLALGSAEVSLVEQANAFRTLANSGKWSPVTFDVARHFRQHPRAIVSPAAAFVVGDILSDATARSEEHTSELQPLMRISYAVFCLKK